MSNENQNSAQSASQNGVKATVKIGAQSTTIGSNKPSGNSLKYRKKVELAVSGINGELSKIMSSSTTVKNIDGIESDMTRLGRKVTELKRALNEPKKEVDFNSPNSQKISKQLDKLIEIATKNDIQDADKEILLKELKKNLGETGNYLAIVKKAIDKTDPSESFSFDS